MSSGKDSLKPETHPFACPRCRDFLESKVKGFECKKCKRVYPSIKEIPVLMPDPESWIKQWRDAWDAFSYRSEKEELTLREQLKRSGLLEETRSRLASLISGGLAHRKVLQEILRPLLSEKQSASASLVKEANRQLNVHDFSITAYASNLLRDWGWNSDENQKTFEIFEKLVGEKFLNQSGSASTQKILVLGAGAGRLAYDIHRACSPDLTVALDFNPVLLLAASRLVYDGDRLDWIESVQTPVDGFSSAVTVSLEAPEKLSPEKFVFCIGDALQPPFPPESFDIVITPWMIDVVPVDMKIFVARVNALLKKGGRWLNVGPLGYNPREASLKYGTAEIQTMIPDLGFKVEKWDRYEIPYLNSPHSCQSRFEKVLGFSASKVSSLDPTLTQPSPQSEPPPWLEGFAAISVPALPEFTRAMQTNKLLADILSLIDGKRTLSDMTALLAHHYQLDSKTASELIRKYLQSLIS